jgi:hypothetical protein
MNRNFLSVLNATSRVAFRVRLPFHAPLPWAGDASTPEMRRSTFRRAIE